MTEWQIITRVELPLAAPLLIGGLRATALQVIATLGIASAFAFGGLGIYLINGLAQGDYVQLLAGAILDHRARPHRRRPPGRRATIRRAARSLARPRGSERPPETRAGTTPACTPGRYAVMKRHTEASSRASRSRPQQRWRSPDARAPARSAAAGAASSKTSVVVGSANFPENVTLAYVYGQALAADGVTVSYKVNIGERAAYIPALQKGEIDLIPEYAGSILSYLDKTANAKSGDDVKTALDGALPKGLKALDFSAAADSDSLNVTPEFAKANNLKSIADLANVSGTVDRRGQPRVRDPSGRHPRPEERLRAEQPHVPGDQRRRWPGDAEGAARQHGAGRRHLQHHAVDPRQQARHAEGPEEPVRVAAGRADRHGEQGVEDQRRCSTRSRRS